MVQGVSRGKGMATWLDTGWGFVGPQDEQIERCLWDADVPSLTPGLGLGLHHEAK